MKTEWREQAQGSWKLGINRVGHSFTSTKFLCLHKHKIALNNFASLLCDILLKTSSKCYSPDRLITPAYCASVSHSEGSSAWFDSMTGLLKLIKPKNQGFRLRLEAGRCVRSFSIPCPVLWFQYLTDFFIILLLLYNFFLLIKHLMTLHQLPYVFFKIF